MTDYQWEQIQPEQIRRGDVISPDLEAGLGTVAVVNSSYPPGKGPINGVWCDPTNGKWDDTGYSSRRHFTVLGPVKRRIPATQMEISL